MGWDTLNEMHRILQSVVPLDSIEVCPHSDTDACVCRKPKPGMLLAAADKYGIDLATSYFIGATERDVNAALAAGVTPILIDWPYNRGVPGQYRFKDLAEPARLFPYLFPP